MLITRARVKMNRLGPIVLGFVTLVAPASLSAQQASPPTLDRPSAENGAQLYKTWCATCHGLSAQGNGPLAPMMKQPVPDLTQVAARNGGVFPSARVRRIVDGREVASHGDRDMPVWGTAFRSSKEALSETAARARIEAIVGYLEGIQNRNAD